MGIDPKLLTPEQEEAARARAMKMGLYSANRKAKAAEKQYLGGLAADFAAAGGDGGVPEDDGDRREVDARVTWEPVVVLPTRADTPVDKALRSAY